jgi:hypothetical protein
MGVSSMFYFIRGVTVRLKLEEANGDGTVSAVIYELEEDSSKIISTS